MAHHSAHTTLSAEMQQCIHECLDCHGVCLEAVRQCLEMGGRHAEARHQILLQDCAEICQTAANFMLRHSERHRETCSLCARICRACEEGCRSVSNDPVMVACAEACRRCAELCERMGA